MAFPQKVTLLFCVCSLWTSVQHVSVFLLYSLCNITKWFSVFLYYYVTVRNRLVHFVYTVKLYREVNALVVQFILCVTE
jgi:hypothetical protein